MYVFIHVDSNLEKSVNFEVESENDKQQEQNAQNHLIQSNSYMFNEKRL